MADPGDRYDPAVRIVDHDPAWAALARQEIDRVRGALGPLVERLEHIGSTAVPGLGAKPILDLQLSVAALEPREPYAEPLERLGYRHFPDAGSPRYHFFARPPERPRSHHLHVCEAGSRHELRHLALRDYLRAHPAEAARYEAAQARARRTPPPGPARLHRGQGPLRRRAGGARARVGRRYPRLNGSRVAPESSIQTVLARCTRAGSPARSRARSRSSSSRRTAPSGTRCGSS